MTNYTVLARKYRSQTFDDLIGQDVLVKTLKTAIETNRLAHAYIFTGIRGTGKTSTARILAKALNCLGEHGDLTSPTTHPCSVCENCIAIANGTHIDVMEIDAASHTGVDNIRDIIENAGYKPTNGRYKIYIIDEVHMLSKNAFNALLKTLEEPPAHVIFILATTDIQNVPITILSRCQRFDLVRVDKEILKKHFFKIATAENIKLEESACELIANYADGSVRDGLSLLDQAIAQTDGNITEEALLHMLQRADRNIIVPLTEKLLTGDIESVLDTITNVHNQGADLRLLLTDLMDVIYWLTRISVIPSSINSAPYTNSNKELLQQITTKTTIPTLSRVWQMMVLGLSEFQNSINIKQTFDMLVIRITHMIDIPPIKDILNEQKNNFSNNITESKQSTIENKSIKVEGTPISKNSVSISEPIKQTKIEIHNIADLIHFLSNNKELTLLDSIKNDVEINKITNGEISLFNRNPNNNIITKLKKFLDENTGKEWSILSSETTQGFSTIAEKSKTVAENDPLVQNALGLFSNAKITNITGE